MPRSPTMTMLAQPELVAHHADRFDERGRVGGVAGEDPDRDRPAVPGR